MFRILDGRDSFYQWDIDRKLIVNDNSIKEVHFCNKTDECSLVCETYQEDELTVVNVPNILLQDSWKIRVYGYDANYTKYCSTFGVVKRSKPADYVYTETEIRKWEDIENRMNEFEKNGVSAEMVEKAVNNYLEENPIETNKPIETFVGVIDADSHNIQLNFPLNFENGSHDIFIYPNKDINFDGSGWSVNGSCAVMVCAPNEDIVGMVYASSLDGLTTYKGELMYCRLYCEDNYIYTFEWFNPPTNAVVGKQGENGKDGISVTHSWNGTELTLTSASGTTTTDLKGDRGEQGIQGLQGIQGVQGEQGKPFTIAKSYSSIEEMNGDFNNPSIDSGAFVIIVSSVNNEDNAKLFCKGETEYTFICDLSGMQGIQGEQGIQGVQGIQGEQGLQGIQGENGYTPIKGTDYWTTADKTEMLADVFNSYTVIDGNQYHGSNFDNNKGTNIDGRYTVKIIRFGCFVAIQGYIYCHTTTTSSNNDILTNLPFAPIAAFETYDGIGSTDSKKVRVQPNGNITLVIGTVNSGTLVHLNLMYACKDR